MKNNILNIALFFLVIAATSCNKISENIQQDIVVNDTAYFDIPVLSANNSSITISGIPLSMNLEEQVKSSINNFTVNQIKVTKIKSLNLALGLLEKDSIDTKNNFSNLESVKFRIAANGNFGNMASTIISSGGTIGALALTPNMVPDSLKAFLINPSKTYSVIIKAKTATTTPMKVRAATSYTITLAK